LHYARASPPSETNGYQIADASKFVRKFRDRTTKEKHNRDQFEAVTKLYHQVQDDLAYSTAVSSGPGVQNQASHQKSSVASWSESEEGDATTESNEVLTLDPEDIVDRCRILCTFKRILTGWMRTQVN
jgi:hypothetical protein